MSGESSPYVYLGYFTDMETHFKRLLKVLPFESRRELYSALEASTPG